MTSLQIPRSLPFLKTEVEFAAFQSTGSPPGHHELSKIIQNGLTITSANSLSTCGCNLSGPRDLCVFTLFKQALANLVLLHHLTSKDQCEEDIEDYFFYFFYFLVIRAPTSFNSGLHIFLSLPLGAGQASAVSSQMSKPPASSKTPQTSVLVAGGGHLTPSTGSVPLLSLKWVLMTPTSLTRDSHYTFCLCCR